MRINIFCKGAGLSGDGESVDNMGDFARRKVVWKRIGSILRFSHEEDDIMCLDSTCFATGRHTEYLCCFLNSKMGHYMLKDAPTTGTGDLLVSVQAV